MPRAVLLTLLLFGGCTDGAEVDPDPTSPATTTIAVEVEEPITADYLPGVEARIVLPEERGGAPLVVMIPGGAWLTADPAGFEGLALHLAGEGIIAAPVVVRAAEDGVVYPTPVEDALCAVAFAVRFSTSSGLQPGPVVLLGHSSGAHLAALAALGTVPYPAGCPYPEAVPEALIGLAGVYDVSLLPDLAEPLFGVPAAEDPAFWEEGNPQALAALRPEVPVLLVHGEADDLVPVAFTSSFASALEEGGHPTTVELVPGAGHHEAYAAERVGDLIVGWVRGLPGE